MPERSGACLIFMSSALYVVLDKAHFWVPLLKPYSLVRVPAIRHQKADIRKQGVKDVYISRQTGLICLLQASCGCHHDFVPPSEPQQAALNSRTLALSPGGETQFSSTILLMAAPSASKVYKYGSKSTCKHCISKGFVSLDRLWHTYALALCNPSKSHRNRLLCLLWALDPGKNCLSSM